MLYIGFVEDKKLEDTEKKPQIEGDQQTPLATDAESRN